MIARIGPGSLLRGRMAPYDAAGVQGERFLPSSCRASAARDPRAETGGRDVKPGHGPPSPGALGPGLIAGTLGSVVSRIDVPRATFAERYDGARDTLTDPSAVRPEIQQPNFEYGTSIEIFIS